MFIKKILPLILLGCLLILCTWVQISYMGPSTAGTDQNGYHICAQCYLKNGVFYQKPVDDLQFIGSMWVVNKRGEYYPKYPPLYPVLIAWTNQLFGSGAGFYLTSVGLILSIAGMFVLGCFFAGRWFGLAGAFILACSPVLEQLGITHNSHTPSLAFLLWGMSVFFAGAKHRHRMVSYALTVLSGALIGYTVGIRYTDFLLIFIPVSYILCFYRGKNRWLHLLSLGFGTAIPWTMMALFHWQAYGAPWRSGYSLTSESSGFEFKFMLDNLMIYVPQFCSIMAGPACAAAVFAGRLRWKRIVFWSVWILPTFLLYLTYYWAPQYENTGTMRFVTPILPAVILLAIIAMRRLRNLYSPQTVTIGIILLLLIQWVWGWSWFTRWAEARACNLTNVVLTQEVLRRIPAGSCIIASENFLNELDFEQKWRLYSSSLFTPNEIRNKIKRSLDKQAAGLQHDRAKALDAKLGKKNYGQLYLFWRNFFEQQQKDGREVWFLGRTWEVNRYLRIFGPFFELEKMGRITGVREAWVFREIKKDASRYYSHTKPVTFINVEVLRLGKKRNRILPREERIKMLNIERNELITLLNPERDQEIADRLNRLESNRSERESEQRAVADEKRRAKLRQQQRKKQQEEAKRKAALRKKQQEEAKRKAALRKKQQEEAAKKKAKPAQKQTQPSKK